MEFKDIDRAKNNMQTAIFTIRFCIAAILVIMGIMGCRVYDVYWGPKGKCINYIESQKDLRPLIFKSPTPNKEPLYSYLNWPLREFKYLIYEAALKANMHDKKNQAIKEKIDEAARLCSVKIDL